jgi:hypothetical protein
LHQPSMKLRLGELETEKAVQTRQQHGVQTTPNMSVHPISRLCTARRSRRWGACWTARSTGMT